MSGQGDTRFPTGIPAPSGTGFSRRAFLITGAASAGLVACRSSVPDTNASAADPGASQATAGAARRTSNNPYMAGNFAPVPWETTAFDLPVDGSLPADLGGTLVRIGPNPIVVDDPGRHHWFLGDGMMHAIQIEDGKANYRSRWIRTDAASELLGEEPLPDQPDDHPIVPTMANTSLVWHGGRLLATYEVSLPTEVTPAGQTVGRYDYGGLLRPPMTAHPKIDHVTGEMVMFGMDPFIPRLQYQVVDHTGSIVLSQEIPIDRPVMMHDFAVTTTKVVFLDLPVLYDLDLLPRRSLPAMWRPEEGARLGVMSRGGGDVKWIEIPTCFVHHVANAYDDGDAIILDVVNHGVTFLHDDYGPGDGTPRLERWRLDPATGKFDQTQVSDQAIELPQIDRRLTARPHRYVYGPDLDFVNLQPRVGGIRRFDLDTGDVVEADLWAGAQSGEALFVEASSGSGEDEGWVLAAVYEPEADASSVVVIDASDFTAPPVARIDLPTRLPFGFHGTWVPAG
jgi:carotenoid cleavage oxygenase